MEDRETIVKKRKSAKFYCAFLGKGVLSAIEYTAAATMVLEYCSLLARYDKHDSPEDTAVSSGNEI